MRKLFFVFLIISASYIHHDFLLTDQILKDRALLAISHSLDKTNHLVIEVFEERITNYIKEIITYKFDYFDVHFAYREEKNEIENDNNEIYIKFSYSKMYICHQYALHFEVS